MLQSAVAAAAPSNPAFLGISMDDAPPIGCSIRSVTAGSPAQEAGLRFGDVIAAIDGVATATSARAPCTFLREKIMASPPGDLVRFLVRRGTDKLVIKIPLSTRAEVLHRRFVGQVMEPTELVDLDDPRRSYDLAELRGRTTVVGWFMLEDCVGCSAVFDRVVDGLRGRLHDRDVAPAVLAVTAPGRRGELTYVRKAFSSTVPIAVADSAEFEDLALKDADRVNFMVIDCRGVVRFVAPIAPGSDDLEAAIDEVLAAAEQAEHLRSSARRR